MFESIGWLAAVGVAVATAGFVQSAIGFGFAGIALAILSFFVEMHLANLIVSLSALLPLALSLVHYRSMVEWPDLGAALLGAGLAMGPGVLIFRWAPADLLVRGTGVVILLIALDGLRRQPTESLEGQPARRGISFLVGVASGMLSGSVGIGGPPIAAYVVRQPWSARRMKGFLVGFLFLVAIIKASALTVAGLMTWSIAGVAALVAPMACAGTVLGVRVSRRWPQARFRRIALCLLAAISIGMIVRGSQVAPSSKHPPGIRSDSRPSVSHSPVHHATNEE